MGKIYFKPIHSAAYCQQESGRQLRQETREKPRVGHQMWDRDGHSPWSKYLVKAISQTQSQCSSVGLNADWTYWRCCPHKQGQKQRERITPVYVFCVCYCQYKAERQYSAPAPCQPNLIFPKLWDSHILHPRITLIHTTFQFELSPTNLIF